MFIGKKKETATGPEPDGSYTCSRKCGYRNPVQVAPGQYECHGPECRKLPVGKQGVYIVDQASAELAESQNTHPWNGIPWRQIVGPNPKSRPRYTDPKAPVPAPPPLRRGDKYVKDIDNRSFMEKTSGLADWYHQQDFSSQPQPPLHEPSPSRGKAGPNSRRKGASSSKGRHRRDKSEEVPLVYGRDVFSGNGDASFYPGYPQDICYTEAVPGPDNGKQDFSQNLTIDISVWQENTSQTHKTKTRETGRLATTHGNGRERHPKTDTFASPMPAPLKVKPSLASVYCADSGSKPSLERRKAQRKGTRSPPPVPPTSDKPSAYFPSGSAPSGYQHSAKLEPLRRQPSTATVCPPLPPKCMPPPLELGDVDYHQRYVRQMPGVQDLRSRTKSSPHERSARHRR